MNMRLYERRTATELIDAWQMNEDICLFCHANGSVKPLESLKSNVHGLQDAKGILMMEQGVVCEQCDKAWVDIFCRMYLLDQ